MYMMFSVMWYSLFFFVNRYNLCGKLEINQLPPGVTQVKYTHYLLGLAAGGSQVLQCRRFVVVAIFVKNPLPLNFVQQ